MLAPCPSRSSQSPSFLVGHDANSSFSVSSVVGASAGGSPRSSANLLKRSARSFLASKTIASISFRTRRLLPAARAMRGAMLLNLDRKAPITSSMSAGRSCYEVHGACDVRINLYPAAPIRLTKVLLAWTIVQEGWGSSFERQIGKRRSAMRTYSHTSNPPDTPDWGCRNSAHCQRYRVRVAPCGTRPCSR